MTGSPSRRCRRRAWCRRRARCYHKLVTGMDDPRGEPPSLLARAALLLASEPAEKVNGRVTYSQQILQGVRLDHRGAWTRG